ncbi:sensor histidine kinase [Frigoribacterium sp. PhB24]|uniref:sensor histidine kinase n=1 Tax=Frigoribacterium sp. PhB24 TaxID=2485204 RepID=UPI0013158A30|nr:histidine kinase [Frigoribacterium sp. PhB24]
MQTNGTATTDRGRTRLVVLALVGAAYFGGLAVALRLEWYPQALPGYLYLGVVALVACATLHRWPVETLVVVTAFTAYTTLAPLPPALYGLYLGPPEALVPLAVVVFLTISGRGPVLATGATFVTLSVLVVLPWRDVAAAGVQGVPLSQVLLSDAGQDRSVVLGRLLACGIVVTVAVLLRRQREATTELARTNRELLVLRAGEVARISEHERTRIARDVHDEVGHHVAALVIRAQAALRVADDHPEQLAPAMRDIAAGGQDVLGRIRGVLRVLRAAPAEAAGTTSVVDELALMTGRLTSLGYEVESMVHLGDDLPTERRVTVLAVVREGLTNAMLHSSAHRVHVTLDDTSGATVVTVTDPGPARERFPDVPRGGAGIPSMRDRVRAAGGSLTTGPGPDGTGWRVRAELPATTVVAAASASSAGRAA